MNWLPTRRIVSTIASTVMLAAMYASPSLADPFRSSSPRPIGDKTEAAFDAIFKQGNYRAAESLLRQPESNEPLAFALKASLAYTDWQGEREQAKKQQFAAQFQTYANQTREAASKLASQDPLRSNLYIAVGNFLEAAHIMGTQGTVKGTPQALAKLQEGFKYMDTAQKLAPEDPELNLIKGFMDLMLSLNLPFSNSAQAIARLEQYAGPRYLADRGVAVGYRDLNQPTKAMEAVNRALQITPDNPELLYLKAQILVRQGNNRDSIPLFEKALTKKDQLPGGLVKQMARELDKSKRRLANVGQ